MQNAIRKVTAVVLAMLMCVMAIPAMSFAAGPSGESTPSGTYTITINTVDGHTYKVYQLATGTTNDKEVLGDLQPGENVKTNYVQNEGDEPRGVTRADIEALSVKSGLDLSNAALALINQSSNPKATLVGNGSAMTTDPLAPGYYVVVDTYTDNKANDNDATSAAMVQLVNGDETITPKNDGVPFPEKTVDNPNGPTASIGDTVSFTLKGWIPNVTRYDSFVWVFVDKLSPGLNYADNSDNVTGYIVDASGNRVKDAGSEDVTLSFTVTEDEKTNEVKFALNDGADVKDLLSGYQGKTIQLSYNTTLNSDASCGNTGNVNSVKIEYGHDPGTETTSTETKVYTTQITINKLNEKSEQLAGAEFSLKGADNKDYKINKDETGTIFTARGLKAQKYTLTEETTPGGYDTIEPIEFTLAFENGKWKCTDNSNITVGEETGHASTNVVNKPGTPLPSTGGIGTTIFYVVGGIIVVGAVVALVVRSRRKQQNNG